MVEQMVSTQQMSQHIPFESIFSFSFSNSNYCVATGSKTAIYNVEDTGDPNKDFNPKKEQGEDQYFIKWTGWSHLHNTWESKDTLYEQHAKGLKKLENFIKRDDELKAWKKDASPEDYEYIECQTEMLDNLLETHKRVERIISHNKVRTSGPLPDYLCKWDGLPYAECTWEDGELIQKRFPQQIKEYESRNNSQSLPNIKSNKLVRVRPRFVTLPKQPEYLGDYFYFLLA